jgi:taurine dioxygenase
MHFQVQPLSENLAFGSIVTDLDMSTLEDPIVRQALTALWVDRGLVVFQGLATDEEGHIALSSVFGTPEIHPLRDPSKPGRPELSDIRYDSVFGEVYEFADGSRRGAWLPWHFDLVYVDRINHGGILRPIVVPEGGGETGFIDQISAYDTLAERLKERIDTLEVVYRFDIDASEQRFGSTPGLKLRRMDPRSSKLMSRSDGFPEVVHPLVFRQPETGRKVLNVSPWFALGIEGMAGIEGDTLLAEVIAHATDETGAYFHKWDTSDLVLWDNWRMMHCAKGVPAESERHLQRTTILGDYGRGRVRTTDTVVDDALRINV